jgi:hypothetical protein
MAEREAKLKAAEAEQAAIEAKLLEGNAEAAAEAAQQKPGWLLPALAAGALLLPELL